MRTLLKLEQVEHHTVDLDKYRAGEMTQEECAAIAEELAATGILLLKDASVDVDRAESFLDVMEEYYARPWEELEKDMHPEVAYQYGLTPPNQERPRGYSDDVKQWSERLTDDHMPLTYRMDKERNDTKLRFMWQAGPRNEESQWPSLNQKTPVPEDLAYLGDTLDAWAERVMDIGFTLAEIIAIGFGMDKNAIRDMMQNGPHILGPTGYDLNDVTEEDLGYVMTGLHNDTNVMTIHGHSRYRGLVAWDNKGNPFLVNVPKGTLLCQAGRMLEYVTAGYVESGMHEVVVLPETLEDLAAAKERGGSTWRVSSNLFMHIASDQVLKPMGRFADRPAADQFPPTYAGNFCMRTWVETEMIDADAMDGLPEDPQV